MCFMGALLLLLLGASPILRAQDRPLQRTAATVAPAEATPTVTFKSGVSDVRVDALVLNQGQVVTGLTAQDFYVYDNNVQQQIRYFAREAEPLSLILLVDVSGSMQKYVQQVASVAREALRVLKPKDRVALMVFGLHSELKHDFTENLDEIVDALRNARYDDKLGAGTAINEALLDSAKYMEEHTEERGRKAVLILTDNLGLNYKSPDDPVIQSFFGADTVLNALVVGKASKPAPITPGHYTNPDFTPPDVYHIADETGGEAVKADRVTTDFPSMIERIRTRYTIQYNMPANASGFRNVRIELTPLAKARYPMAVIHARRGYNAGVSR